MERFSGIYVVRDTSAGILFGEKQIYTDFRTLFQEIVKNLFAGQKLLTAYEKAVRKHVADADAGTDTKDSAQAYAIASKVLHLTCQAMEQVNQDKKKKQDGGDKSLRSVTFWNLYVDVILRRAFQEPMNLFSDVAATTAAGSAVPSVTDVSQGKMMLTREQDFDFTKIYDDDGGSSNAEALQTTTTDQRRLDVELVVKLKKLLSDQSSVGKDALVEISLADVEMWEVLAGNPADSQKIFSMVANHPEISRSVYDVPCANNKNNNSSIRNDILQWVGVTDDEERQRILGTTTSSSGSSHKLTAKRLCSMLMEYYFLSWSPPFENIIVLDVDSLFFRCCVYWKLLYSLQFEFITPEPFLLTLHGNGQQKQRKIRAVLVVAQSFREMVSNLLKCCNTMLAINSGEYV